MNNMPLDESACTLIEMLDMHAKKNPNSIAYTKLDKSLKIENQLSFKQLKDLSCELSSHLNSILNKGDIVVVGITDIIDFIKVFFACLRSFLI